MGSDHVHLHFHIEVMWMSRDQVLNRATELKEGLKIYFEQVLAGKSIKIH